MEPPQRRYRDSGVDIERGNRAVARIAQLGARYPGTLGPLGGFAGAFPLGEETLLAGADGVGTKVLLAQAMGKHAAVGTDLVAMNVNDVLAQGGRPLFFLDYIALHRIDEDLIAQLVEGMLAGCAQAGCRLLGGETAEMPDMYPPGHYDLAGFAVGVRRFAGRSPRPGDRLVGLASAGLHANGFSLVRQVVVKDSGMALDQPVPALEDPRPLGEVLLAPTRIYVRPVTELWGRFEVAAMAHITGGGLLENVPRVLAGAGMVLDLDGWPRPPLFRWLAEIGRIPVEEMLRTFNCGIGFVLVVEESAAAAVREFVAHHGVSAFEIGSVTADPGVRWEGTW